MRRLLTFAVLLALALPAASAARTRGANDGTLSVKDARGTIFISARGGVIGSFAQGKVTIVRFRIIGGAFKIRVQGRGINLSLVGKGNVTLNGAGTGADGMYSVNGDTYSVIPDFLFSFVLSATSP